MKNNSKITAIPMNKNGTVNIVFDKKQKKHTEAVYIVVEMIEKITQRNIENFTFEEALKLRIITLTLIDMLVQRGINLKNWERNKEILEELLKIAIVKLKEADLVWEV